MGNSLRCCLACILPCGALDLIRIVHLNGHVDEITRPTIAGEILQANPNHVLSKPCSQGVVRKILILSPDSQLKRGSIYFLIPDPEKNKNKKRQDLRRRRKILDEKSNNEVNMSLSNSKDLALSLCEKYLEDVMMSSSPEKSCLVAGKENRHRRRHSRSASVSTWRPHLDCIDEDLN
ncbi:unnamed protein product [Cochlearia groenlandica]